MMKYISGSKVIYETCNYEIVRNPAQLPFAKIFRNFQSRK